MPVKRAKRLRKERDEDNDPIDNKIQETWRGVRISQDKYMEGSLTQKWHRDSIRTETQYPASVKS